MFCCQLIKKGGPMLYCIYVDSGVVVMLCLFALAPANLLIAAAAFMYFLMHQWTMTFLYKPRFDHGRNRFPSVSI
jgi:hypothetical protein